MRLERDLILAGDIGGTKTNLAIYAPDSGLKNPLASTAYASGEYADLDSMLAEFLADTGLK
ncbi:MAG: glucokinase, partial [Deltaproteobacteria bacterium]|nr:glucokinase [Deltaproteobacteria bacterium]